MQQFKPYYQDSSFIGTFSNIQQCLRLNDLYEIGDKTHRLNFEMIGFFSFRQYSLQETIDLIIEFLKRLDLKPDYVTIHPDKISEWSDLYYKHDVEIRPDSECKWSDGQIGGYCTEFYIQGIEIGNIVNPLGDCIDVGFGLERLLMVSGQYVHKNKLELLEESTMLIIESGILVGDYKEGHVLKKLINLCIQEGSKIEHVFFNKQREFQIQNYINYKRNKIKPRHKNKDSSYWLNTFGIDENNLNYYEKLIE